MVLNSTVKIFQSLKYKFIVLLSYFICTSLAFSLISINYHIYNLPSRYLFELNHPMWQMMHVGNLSGGLVQLIMELTQNVCFTQRSSAPVLCNLHWLSAGCCVQFRMLFLTSVILNHSHVEERANSGKSCFTLVRWSESWINRAMGAESNKWGSIPPAQVGICVNSGHRISGQLRESLCLPIDCYVPYLWQKHLTPWPD